MPAATTKRLDQKIARIREGRATAADFIIADAKDADMAFGITAPGPAAGAAACAWNRDAKFCYTESAASCWKTLADYRAQIREVIAQDIVDIMLLSASNLEQLGMTGRLFENSAITPAARANDTTDIWAVRGGKYASHPSRAFRTASLDHIKYGRLPAPGETRDYTAPATGADLGLYSITFTNNIDWDYHALEAFHAFRHEAERKRFRYFLEVFNPNVNPAIPDRTVAAFLNDHIVRTLAGVTAAGRPLFLKIPYNGPGPLEELVAYDPGVIVGILGGGAGTTLDAFQLIHDAQKHGARVALFGRKINLSEHPLTFIHYLRRITDGVIAPVEAVKAYHADLERLGLKPQRHLTADLRQTATAQSYR